jgi:hypothetical protein
MLLRASGAVSHGTVNKRTESREGNRVSDRLHWRPTQTTITILMSINHNVLQHSPSARIPLGGGLPFSTHARTGTVEYEPKSTTGNNCRFEVLNHVTRSHRAVPLEIPMSELGQHNDGACNQSEQGRHLPARHAAMSMRPGGNASPMRI